MSPAIWIPDACGFPVEKDEIRRPHHKPYYPARQTPQSIGVLHTTESQSLDSALRTFKASGSAPHFLVGRDRIIQCRPVGAAAACLRSDNLHDINSHALVQIEMVAFSSTSPWLPEDETLQPTLHLLAWATSLGIPLTAPWGDDYSDLHNQIWASNNSRRRRASSGLWPKMGGWWMHLEVPFQGPTWHFDCGALRRTMMLKMARSHLPAGVEISQSASLTGGGESNVNQSKLRKRRSPSRAKAR